MLRSDYTALQSHDVEAVLERPHGQAVLDACGGDAEHALRILDEVDRRRRVARANLGELIALPSPILDLEDVLDDELEPAPRARRLSSWSWLSAAIFAGVGVAIVGLAIGLAALAYGLLRLSEAIA